MMAGAASKSDAPLSEREIAEVFRHLSHEPIALAVSGGVDSMVLMHLFASWKRTPAAQKWAELVESRRRFVDQRRPPAIGLPKSIPELSVRADWLGTEPSQPAISRAIGSKPAVVLTVDHDLRPGSAEDAAFVMLEAERLGLPCQTFRWTSERGAPWQRAKASLAPGAGIIVGLQEKARTARYELMADAVESELWQLWEAGEDFSDPLESPGNRRLIVTAHNRDDLIETFIMRLKRGAGLDGLSSIRMRDALHRPPTNERAYPATVELLRPLLDIPRTRILATARQLGITWRNDPSNDDDRFERVAVRKSAQAFRDLGFEPGQLFRSIRRLQRAREAVVHQRNSLLYRWQREGAFDWNAGLFAIFRPFNVSVDTAQFSPHGDPYSEARIRILQYAIRGMGGGVSEPSLRQLENLSRDITGAIVKLAQFAPVWRDANRAELDGVTSGSACTLAGCRIDLYLHRVYPGFEAHARIWREIGRRPLPELRLQPGEGGWWDNRFAVSLSPSAPEGAVVRALGRDGWREIKRRIPALSLWRGVPRTAGETLPAVWLGERIISVPFFEQLEVGLPRWLKLEIDHEWGATSGLGGTVSQARFAPILPG
jgi:tRNA(Ile)-lysidine synthase